MKNQEQKCEFNVKATLLYPKEETTKNGIKKSYALEISEDASDTIADVCEKVLGYAPTMNESEEDDSLRLLNVKTSFDFPIFDKEGNELSGVRIYHGANVIAKVACKEYTYKGKHGATTYLVALVLIENGQPTGISFKSIYEGAI